jgi:hypothetical protein
MVLWTGLVLFAPGLNRGSDREGVNSELYLKVFTTLAWTQQDGGKFVNSHGIQGPPQC